MLSLPAIKINNRAASEKKNTVFLRKETVYVLEFYRLVEQHGVGTLNQKNVYVL